MSRQNNTDGAGNDGEKASINRRHVLKASGIGVAAASLPLTGLMTRNGVKSRSVDTSDPKSKKKFTLDVLNADSKQEVEKLWKSLNAKEARAVADYMNEHSTTELGTVRTDTDWDTIETESGTVPTVQVDSSKLASEFSGNNGTSDVRAQGHFIAQYDVPVKRRLMGYPIYVMHHLMRWGGNSNSLYFIRDNSRCDGKVPYWFDLRQSYKDHHAYTNHVNSYITREYEHNAPGVCDKFYAKIDLRGFRNGHLEAIRKNAAFNKHHC